MITPKEDLKIENLRIYISFLQGVLSKERLDLSHFRFDNILKQAKSIIEKESEFSDVALDFDLIELLVRKYPEYIRRYNEKSIEKPYYEELMDILTKEIENSYSNYEAKQPHRFIVKFSEDLDIPSYVVQSITLPKISENNEYDNIKIKFRDIEQHNITKKLYAHLKVPTANLEVNIINAKGEVINQWAIKYRIYKIDFGNLNYNQINNTGVTEDIAVEMIIKPLEIFLIF